MTTDRPFRVNTKKARSAAAKAECAEELGALFSCMMVRERRRGREKWEFSLWPSAAAERRSKVRSRPPAFALTNSSLSSAHSPTLSSQANKYDVDVACAGHRRALDACVAAAVSFDFLLMLNVDFSVFDVDLDHLDLFPSL